MSTDTQKPEALRLADAIDPLIRGRLDNLTCAATAAMLRSQHAEIERLKQAQERKPVWWIDERTGFCTNSNPYPAMTPLYTNPAPSQQGERVRELEKDRDDFAEFIARDNQLGSDDWACIRCHPNADYPIKGFTCVAHRAIDAARNKEQGK